MTAVRWQAEAIWEAVSPLLPTFSVEILPEIDSTNTELMRRARAGQLDPVLLVAERQSAGRGRLGRSWSSGGAVGGQFPAGPPQGKLAPSGGSDPRSDGAWGSIPSLTFSLGLPLSPADWSGLSLAVGLAVVESLHPALQLKWPNDVWLQDRKLAGILIETANVAPTLVASRNALPPEGASVSLGRPGGDGRGEARYAVIGIGINILPPNGEGLRTPPAALCELLPDVDAPAALALVAASLVRAVRQFEAEGFAPLRTAFHTRDLLYGRELVCSDGTTGTARGVDAGGALLLHTEQGLKKITSAEVSVRPVPLAPPPSSTNPF